MLLKIYCNLVWSDSPFFKACGVTSIGVVSCELLDMFTMKQESTSFMGWSIKIMALLLDKIIKND